MRELSKQLPPGFHTKRDDFITSLDKEKMFKPFGTLLHSYTRKKGQETHNHIFLFATFVHVCGMFVILHAPFTENATN